MLPLGRNASGHARFFSHLISSTTSDLVVDYCANEGSASTFEAIEMVPLKLQMRKARSFLAAFLGCATYSRGRELLTR